MFPDCKVIYTYLKYNAIWNQKMKKIYIISIVIFLTVLIGCTNGRDIPMYTSGEYEESFVTTMSKTIGYRYHVYIPDGYTDTTKFPLLLFLHGAGERGDNLDRVKWHGLDNMLTAIDPFPFIVISPQVPEGELWDSETLNALLDVVTEKLSVDANRIYVTGLSMGGNGTWMVITDYPERFAAAIPICGWGERLIVHKAQPVPVWAFHGDADQVIPLSRSEEMVEALRRAGGDASLTVYPGVGHDSWTETYRNPEIYTWLLEQRKDT
jgi:predicted peptidase